MCEFELYDRLPVVSASKKLSPPCSILVGFLGKGFKHDFPITVTKISIH